MDALALYQSRDTKCGIVYEIVLASFDAIRDPLLRHRVAHVKLATSSCHIPDQARSVERIVRHILPVRDVSLYQLRSLVVYRHPRKQVCNSVVNAGGGVFVDYCGTSDRAGICCEAQARRCEQGMELHGVVLWSMAAVIHLVGSSLRRSYVQLPTLVQVAAQSSDSSGNLRSIIIARPASSADGSVVQAGAHSVVFLVAGRGKYQQSRGCGHGMSIPAMPHLGRA